MNTKPPPEDASHGAPAKATPPATHDHDHDHAHDHEAPIPGAGWANYALAASIAGFFAVGVYTAANAPAEAAGAAEENPAEAHHLREEAATLTKEGHWAESLEKLTEAKKLDPAGEKEEAVARLRRIDEAELRSLPPQPHAAPAEKPGKGHSDEAPHESPHETSHPAPHDPPHDPPHEEK